jgi:hypothetical protein
LRRAAEAIGGAHTILAAASSAPRSIGGLAAVGRPAPRSAASAAAAVLFASLGAKLVPLRGATEGVRGAYAVFAGAPIATCAVGGGATVGGAPSRPTAVAPSAVFVARLGTQLVPLRGAAKVIEVADAALAVTSAAARAACGLAAVGRASGPAASAAPARSCARLGAQVVPLIRAAEGVVGADAVLAIATIAPRS